MAFATFTYLMPRRRKAEEFTVKPRDTGNSVIVQSKLSIGEFDIKTGRGRLFTHPKAMAYGPGFPHLAAATPYDFPPDFVAAALAACPSLGGETELFGGVLTVVHNVRTI